MRSVLGRRELNRSLLARQGLLERSPGAALDMVERLVALQAQEPTDPYVGLAARLERFRPQELSELLETRAVVRAQLLRATIHLAGARDALALHTLTLPVLARTFKSSWSRRASGADVEVVVAAGRELLADAPLTRAELAAALGPRWPDAEAAALAQAVTYHLPLVQVPPRALWDRSGAARWALTEDWLGAELDGAASLDAIVLRYLAAFGPASAADVRAWSGFTGLRAVLVRLRPQLVTFADEGGRELFDVPGAPFPDPETPAPPRFLPEYDNVLLAHADRSRTQIGLGPGLPWPSGRWVGTLLVDGFFRAYWNVQGATLTVDRFTPHADDPPGTPEAIAAEGERLLDLIAAGRPPGIRFDPAA